ncbi:hypothetical protein [Enterococcus diestrammenae]|uniref:V-type ATPase, subunit F n=1 Tax=Enterococcus diestrammenae TaxID=1155073 RepID=A0ABV0F4B6_9ENTE|nr:hypothetical protein [Enterococcus diestrammenae]KAF1298701.1 hypothetical protein BAU18_05515 [Enterococcus diestrammenae]
MKEALTKIAQAEAQNEQAQTDLEQSLSRYREQKELELTQLVEDLKVKRAQVFAEKETMLETELKAEKERLLDEAKKDLTDYQVRYDQRHTEIVTEIIERVKGTYGS